jgi:hypothetical protein
VSVAKRLRVAGGLAVPSSRRCVATSRLPATRRAIAERPLIVALRSVSDWLRVVPELAKTRFVPPRDHMRQQFVKAPQRISEANMARTVQRLRD